MGGDAVLNLMPAPVKDLPAAFCTGKMVLSRACRSLNRLSKGAQSTYWLPQITLGYLAHACNVGHQCCALTLYNKFCRYDCHLCGELWHKISASMGLLIYEIHAECRLRLGGSVGILSVF
jgi:hypothetical protein